VLWHAWMSAMMRMRSVYSSIPGHVCGDGGGSRTCIAPPGQFRRLATPGRRGAAAGPRTGTRNMRGIRPSHSHLFTSHIELGRHRLQCDVSDCHLAPSIIRRNIVHVFSVISGVLLYILARVLLPVSDTGVHFELRRAAASALYSANRNSAGY